MPLMLPMAISLTPACAAGTVNSGASSTANRIIEMGRMQRKKKTPRQAARGNKEN